jgi:hypothetical protein
MSQVPPPLPVPPIQPQPQPQQAMHAPPQQVLPYATPMAHQDIGAWREGSQLVVTKHIQLLDRCVKCNAPAEGAPWRKTLYWHHPALYIMILFPGLLIYAIVALCVRQNARVGAYLCPIHRKARSRKILIAWLIALAGLASFIGGFALVGDRDTEDMGLIAILCGIVVMIAGGVFGAITSPVLSPAKMEGNYAWLKGAGNDFLANFPPTGR